ncbi:MAG: YihY/virulence factor BrkB family protein [Desulfobaccales bacterium]
MGQLLSRVDDFFRRGLWQEEDHRPAILFACKCLRILILAVRGLFQNQCLVRSSALAYTTILGFIPLFALLFAILQAIGMPRLLATYFLENLAPGSQDFVNQILHYIENTKVTSLGVFGVVALLCDLVIIMTNVEKAFNKIWQVSQTRSWSRKVSDYLSIFLLFPILMAVAISLSTSFLSIHLGIHGFLAAVLPRTFFTATHWLASLGVLWLAFIFIYLVMPNTRVRFWSAVMGGVVGGSVWQLAQWLFISIQGRAAYYNAIYGALYNLLFIVIWLFWCWLILLFGTEVAFAHQNLDSLTRGFCQPPLPPEPVDEYLGLAALLSISARFQRRQPPLSLEELAEILPQGNNLAARAVQMLQDCNLVVQVAPGKRARSPQFLPNLPLSQVTVAEVLECLRHGRTAAIHQALETDPGLAAVLDRLLQAGPPVAASSPTLKEVVESWGTTGEDASAKGNQGSKA